MKYHNVCMYDRERSWHENKFLLPPNLRYVTNTFET